MFDVTGPARIKPRGLLQARPLKFPRANSLDPD